jgi:hypothetical protein
MPLNTRCIPTTVAELKDLKYVPQCCTDNTLKEQEAKDIFEKLKQKNSKLGEIESIPLPPIDNDKYQNWHTTLLRKIRAFNVHAEKVVKAQTTIQDDEFVKRQEAKAKNSQKINTAEYEGKLDDFWRNTDKSGEWTIQIASEIRQRWSAQEKIKAKKTKAEVGEPGEHE